VSGSIAKTLPSRGLDDPTDVVASPNAFAKTGIAGIIIDHMPARNVLVYSATRPRTMGEAVSGKIMRNMGD